MWDGEEYRISGGGDEDEFELSLAVAYNTLFNRLHDRAMQPMADHIRIHAASGRCGDGLFLLVGEKHAGKTTLAMHLLQQGVEMLGDELVLLRDGVGITFPRRFYLRHAALALLPGLTDRMRQAPFVNAQTEGRLLAADPLTVGRPWRIAPAPVRAVIFIEPNHGGASRLAQSGKVEMIRRVVPQSSPPASQREGWRADLCSTINRADTFVLHLGELDQAGKLLRIALDNARTNCGSI